MMLTAHIELRMEGNVLKLVVRKAVADPSKYSKFKFGFGRIVSLACHDREGKWPVIRPVA